MIPERIETDHLIFERLTHDAIDLFDLYDICSSDPGIENVTEYLPWDPHQTPKQTHDLLTGAESNWESGEDFRYLLRLRESSEPVVGMTGIDVHWGRRTGTIRLWLRKRFWGRGLSGERAAALIEIVFDILDLELLAVFTLEGNERSRRAIEKYIDRYGGQYEGLFRNFRPNDGDLANAHRYTITREQYRNATQ